MIKKLQKMRIQKRLKTSSAYTLGLAGFATLLAIVVMIILINRYNYTLTYYAFPQGDIALAMNEYGEVRSATRAIIGYDDQSSIDQAKKQHDEAVSNLEQLLKTVEKTMVTKEGKDGLTAIRTALDKYYAVEEKVIELGSSTDAALSSQAQKMALNDMTPVYDAGDEAFRALMDVNVQKGDSQQDYLLTLAIILIIVIVVLIVVAFLISTKLSSVTAKGIVAPMEQLISRLDAFSQGDITSPFPEFHQEDEIADMAKAVHSTTVKIQLIIDDLSHVLGEMANGNFNISSSCEEEYVGDFKALYDATSQMNHQVGVALGDVKDASDMVSIGATNLAEASQALAEGATDQAASVEELQAMISEITSALSKTAGEVNAAYDKARECADEAQKSHGEMEVLMKAMAKINETSQKIVNIIAEIEDIASQTNLLSLNAAIEAARAGDAGKGFAVVADQIRNLADQSAKSAVNTRHLIEESINEVEVGNQAATRTSEVLMDVVNSIQAIADTSKILSEMTTQEAESIEQADQGITRISEVVQSNSATAEETSATSEELSAQAVGMDEIIGQFELRDRK